MRQMNYSHLTPRPQFLGKPAPFWFTFSPFSVQPPCSLPPGWLVLARVIMVVSVVALFFVLSTMASVVLSTSVAPTSTPYDLCSAKFDDFGRIVLEDGSVYERVGSPYGGAPRRLEEDLFEPGTSQFTLCVIMTVVCVCFAALAAGLTMGMMSLDPFQMEIIMEANPEDCRDEKEREELRQEQACVRKVLPLLKNRHLLLVTLLLMNSVANEALPLFLDRVVPSYLAVILSVTCVLIFGEVLPSAVFTGPQQLTIAAKLAPLVWVPLGLLYPLAAPISKVLDRLLGHEPVDRYNSAELKALMTLHHEDSEVALLHGALDFKHGVVRDVLTPMDEVQMISTDAAMDNASMADILRHGHSRIPVYRGSNRNDVCGLLLTKRLITLDPEDGRLVSTLLPLRQPLVVAPDVTLSDLLDMFQTGKSHLALVTTQPEEIRRRLAENSALVTDPAAAAAAGSTPPPPVLGVVTLEDVLETLLKTEILDEMDRDREAQGGRGQLDQQERTRQRVARLRSLRRLHSTGHNMNSVLGSVGASAAAASSNRTRLRTSSSPLRGEGSQKRQQQQQQQVIGEEEKLEAGTLGGGNNEKTPLLPSKR